MATAWQTSALKVNLDIFLLKLKMQQELFVQTNHFWYSAATNIIMDIIKLFMLLHTA